MANNTNSSNQSTSDNQSSQNIQLTDEQFKALLNQANSSQQNVQQKSQSKNYLSNVGRKTVDKLDAGTRGYEGSVFSSIRWVASMVKAVIEAVAEFIEIKKEERKRKQEE